MEPMRLLIDTNQYPNDAVSTFAATPNWSRLSPSQKSALRAISIKLSRILIGDANFKDHWADIAGYCERVIES